MKDKHFQCNIILIVLFIFCLNLEDSDRSEDMKGTFENFPSASLSGKLPEKSDQSSGK